MKDIASVIISCFAFPTHAWFPHIVMVGSRKLAYYCYLVSFQIILAKYLTKITLILGLHFASDEFFSYISHVAFSDVMSTLNCPPVVQVILACWSFLPKTNFTFECTSLDEDGVNLGIGQKFLHLLHSALLL